ncbi:MAG: phosphatidylglycerophosphatase A [Pseudomonadota bacterium]
MIRAVVTFGYAGLLTPGPGTWGSLAALPAAWAAHAIGGPVLLVSATVLLFLVGLWATERYLSETPDKDPSEVVIDEVVGQWIALWPVSLGASQADVGPASLWPGVLAAFLAFRAFDIWKPGPVALAENASGAWGVMLDDVVAGWLAAMCVAVAAFVFHGILGA